MFPSDPVVSNVFTEWTVDHMSDVAMLLAKCEGVYSADVPTALQVYTVRIFIAFLFFEKWTLVQ